MATATLSDADVFGPSAPAGGGVLSDADVFGSAKAPKPTTRQPRSDASIALGGAGAGTKAVARSLADFGDMFVSIPGMVMGTAADVSSRIQSFAEGTDPRAAGRIAKGVREGVTSQFSPPIFRQLTEAAIHAVAPDKKNLTNTDVQDGMKLLTDGIEKGGKWVEQKTKGLITAETFDSLVNEGMALGGLKGAGALAEKAVPRPKPTKQAKPPVEPTGPETPTSTAAKRDVRADVEAATGVNRMAPKEAQAAQKARRSQARAAFQEDPQYADYLRNYADEEARMRSTQPDPITAPGGVEQAGPRTPRTGSTDALPEKTLPPGRTQPIETGAPDTLDSALSKIRQGRLFDMTAAEKVRIRGTRQRGSGSTRDMATLGVVAGATALGIVGARSALGPLLNDYGYTLKTLERLPQNRTEFSRQQIEQQLARPDVSKAEKELVQKVLGDKEKLTARELAEGFAAAAKKLELYPKQTDEFADYGLENIGRFADDASRASDLGDIGRDDPTSEEQEFANNNAVPARTTLYRSGSEVDPEANNHFADSKYFAHTRSFDEKGVRHVVEVQSDVAQHAKVLPEAERLELEKSLRTINKLAGATDFAYVTMEHGEGPRSYARALDRLEKAYGPEVVDDFKLRVGHRLYTAALATRNSVPYQFFDLIHGDEVNPSVREKGDFQRVYELTKKLMVEGEDDRRIDREDLSGLSTLLLNVMDHEMRDLDLKARELEAKKGSNLPNEMVPLLKTWYKRIIREEIARGPERPTRFATADTVAKVEGWSEHNVTNFQNLPTAVQEVVKKESASPRFSPEHQSIYNRYKSEIEKFLRNDLGGKSHTDSQGHTWIEVPAQPRGPKYMFGRASTADMAALAAFAGGTAAMAAWSSDPSVVTDIVAGLVASAATRIRPRMLADTVRSMRAAKPLASIGAIAIDRESNIRLAGIDTTNTVRRVAKLVPSEARREAIHEALDTGKPKGLSPNERAAYDILRAEYDRLAQLGLDADTLKNVRVNYATHMWKMDADIFERLFGRRQGFGTSPNTPYSLERAFATMAEGEKAGLKPVSKDAAFVFATYANSLISAVENGKMLKTLREVRTPGGDLLVQKTSEAPHQYVTIQNPQMRGLAVHPEIAPQMRFIFENPSAAGVGAALEIVADVTKRSAVSASLFHVKALVDVLTAAVPGKAKYFAGAAVGAAVGYGVATAAGDEHALREAALAGLAGYVGPRLKAYATGRSAFLDELHKGSNSPFIVRAVKSGLVFGAEKGPLVVDDAGRRFYDAMQLVQKEADRIASPVGIKAGKGVEAYIKANHWMDDMLWGRLHPGMKLEVWSKTSDTIRQASVERNAKSPKSRILSQVEADEIASRYTNDLFGGLNWTRMAMEAKTRLGRVVAQELLSPKGRRAMRIMMFAPDWTISTARSALAAIDKDLVNPLKWGSVAKGMFQPITRGDLARQYAARSALYYLTVGDAINYSMSGHHLWENDDKIGWSFIDWGDGRRMQFSKHIMEVPHWFDHPVKQAVGKLGYVPKEAANQLLGTDYLAPQMGKQGQVFAGPRMKDTSPFGRVKHAAHGLVPIPFQGEMNDSSAWGFAGMPIYGQTREQRERAKRERDDRKRRERR